MDSEGIYSEFLDTELLGRLDSLQLRARFLVAGFMAGLHKAPFRGSSVEFKEYRDYYPGDELKLLDWKAYARTDRLHVKLREEETNLIAAIMLDVSSSMNYRSEKGCLSKWEFARSLAAAFMLFLQKQRDAAALAFIGSRLEAVQRASSRSSNYRQMMVRLHRKADASSSKIARCMGEYLPLLRSRSMVLVFSDFYEDPEALRVQLARMRHMGCEVLLFHILDPLELDFDLEGGVLLRELEGNRRIEVAPELVRDKYCSELQKHLEAIRSVCAQNECEHLLLRTDQAPLHALGCYLAKRKTMQ